MDILDAIGNIPLESINTVLGYGLYLMIGIGAWGVTSAVIKKIKEIKEEI